MIDTHCHLLDSSFDKDRDSVIEQAFSNGVSKLIEVGVEPQEWEDSLDLSQKYKNIFCAIGVHPNNSDKYIDFSDLLVNKKVVAVGECGLDYYRNYVDKKIQVDVFEKQLEIVQKLKKPVIIHSRQAEEDVYKIISQHKDICGVIHCFSSSIEYAEKFLQLGFYLGIDGPVTYPNANVLREVVNKTPIERILLETDSPYLPPQQFRGKRNESGYLKYIAEKIAQIKGLTVETVSKITDENAERLFKISTHE
ncbi:MAG: TatD family hydrolase [Elusimicrobia bacterium]|nr:TatD family hydrolase [Elusimicrobiota bacterium]